MNIGINEIIAGISYTAQKKLSEELKQMGFMVQTDSICDLYAENGDDRRLYELKIGKYKIQKRVYNKLQDYAKERKAKLYIIYLELPKSTMVEVEGLEDILYNDFVNEVPNELDSLSTHTVIEIVDSVRIDSISVCIDTINVEGSGSVELELQFGSRSDLNSGDGWIENRTIDFYFKIQLDYDREVKKSYYKFDLSGI